MPRKKNRTGLVCEVCARGVGAGSAVVVSTFGTANVDGQILVAWSHLQHASHVDAALPDHIRNVTIKQLAEDAKEQARAGKPALLDAEGNPVLLEEEAHAD